MVILQKSIESFEQQGDSGQFQIRRIKASDIPNFIETGLPTCAFMHGRPDIPMERMLHNFAGFVREHAFTDDSEIYIAEDTHGCHAGQLWLHRTRNRFNGHRELWIWDITVAEEFRHKGLGKQLLEFAKQQAASHWFEELWLLVSSVNSVAIELYQSSGLRSLGQLMCFPLAAEVRRTESVRLGATLLRPLSSNDAERLHALWSAAGLPFRPRGRDSLSRLRSFLSGPYEAGWCTEANNELTGAALISDDGRKGWIERLAVHPDFRRAGLAKVIVTACTNSLRFRGTLVIGALIDEDNHISRTLFESCGYVHHSGICYYSYRKNNEH